MTSAVAGFPGILRGQRGDGKPNIIWILGEDFSPDLSCYGSRVARTPVLDKLASEGVRFDRAFTTAPVCSASRSAFCTGLFQTTIGAHNHRSHRDDGFTLPKGVKVIPEHLRGAGYHAVNLGGEFAPGARGTAKEDWNFHTVPAWDSKRLENRPAGKPLYLQVNFSATHKGPAFAQARKEMPRIDPASLPLPPYWPDHPVVRDEYANYLEAATLLDRQVGQLLHLLESQGILQNSAVFFMGDHGQCLIRGKQWLYDAGLRVPLIAWSPGRWKAGEAREDPVLSLDMTATSLVLGGVKPERELHGQDLFGPAAKRRDHVFAARDRCDMTVDRIRSVRDRRYRLIRNFMPERPYTQYNAYIEKQYPTLAVMKELYAKGELNAAQQLFMQPRKPELELYDTLSDPFLIHNLAGEASQKSRVAAMSAQIDRWIVESDDQGRTPEKGYSNN